MANQEKNESKLNHFGLPSELTPARLTKTVQVEDGLLSWVASSVKVKPSPSMTMSQKNAKPCASELSSGLIEKNSKGSNDSTPKQEVEMRKRGRGAFSEIEENNSLITSSYSQKYPRNGPALEIIWRGSFEVLNGPNVGLHDGFLAHPPATISRKAYNFSKRMAGVLQFKLHHRHEQWPKIFQTDGPDGNDIALYFYPENLERSKRKYSGLLKFIEKNDLVLKSHMGDVHLLVFPSRLLSEDSQKLDGSYFMWAVFCNLKGIPIT